MRRTAVAVATLAMALLATTGTTDVHAEGRLPRPPGPALALPEPSGRHPVGRTVMHLTDEGRDDPWVASGDRELMVSLWYPAAKPSEVPAPYMTPDESRLYAESAGQGLPPDLFSAVGTHATVDPRPLRTRGTFPLVVLSPGFGMPRATLTGLAEELAGRGFAVAGIGHNHEAHGTSFPDGRTTSCAACANPDFPGVGAVRAQDVSFVLDELAGRHPAWKRGVRVDTGRVAMVGHSAGGFSTIPAMLRDPRVTAGVNMDGNFRFPNDIPLDRPLLMLGNGGRAPAGSEPTWEETWTELTGWKRWLSVDDTGHLSFTDLAPLAEQLGTPIQPLDGRRADAVTRAVVTAFANTHLRGRDDGLLDGPTAGLPEVRFHRP